MTRMTGKRWGADTARESERGSGTMLVVGVLAVILMFGALAGMVAGYAVAAHGARAAADLTALGAAQAMRTGADPCGAAADLAHSNHTALAACHVSGDPGDFVIEVRVMVHLDVRLPGLPTTLTQRAYAGVAPHRDSPDATPPP